MQTTGTFRLGPLRYRNSGANRLVSCICSFDSLSHSKDKSVLRTTGQPMHSQPIPMALPCRTCGTRDCLYVLVIHVSGRACSPPRLACSAAVDCGDLATGGRRPDVCELGRRLHQGGPDGGRETPGLRSLAGRRPVTRGVARAAVFGFREPSEGDRRCRPAPDLPIVREPAAEMSKSVIR